MTGEEFIGRAKELVPHVKERAEQAEQLRRLPEETPHEFQDAGLFRAFQPEATRLQLHLNFSDLMEFAHARTPVPLERRAQCRFDAARAIDEAWRAGNLVVAASGGSAIFLDNPLQRAARDLLAIRVHPAGNLGQASRSYGRLAFGLESEDLLL
jgi:hypothetical protein